MKRVFSIKLPSGFEVEIGLNAEWIEALLESFRDIVREEIRRQAGTDKTAGATSSPAPVSPLGAPPSPSPERAVVSTRKDSEVRSQESGDGDRVRPVRLIVCTERPGQRFTLDDASALTGKSVSFVYQALAPGGQKKRKGKCGDFHLRWATEQDLRDIALQESEPPIANCKSQIANQQNLHEAQPRHSRAESMPINVHRIGGPATGGK